MNHIHVFNSFLISTLLVVASSTASATDVGVSISIGQPGFYGRIDIGDYPYPVPRLIYRSPIIVHRHADLFYEPLYLRVPPGQAKKWRNYCGRYNACGHPVYFVQDSWYRNEYAPLYLERHGYGRDDWHDGYERGGRGLDGDRYYREESRGNGKRHKGYKGKD